MKKLNTAGQKITHRRIKMGFKVGTKHDARKLSGMSVDELVSIYRKPKFNKYRRKVLLEFNRRGLDVSLLTE